MDQKLLFFGVLFLAFLVFLVATTLITPIPALADANATVLIDVNVTETASITVIPSELNWTGVGTGQVGGAENLTIKNAGSLNVTFIHGYVDTLDGEPLRPYGSGDPTDFSAGGVITIRNETNETYYFAGRIEWNWTEDIPNHDWQYVISPVAWGYFRNTSNDYVWALGNGTPPAADPTGIYCNNTDAEFAIEDQVDIGTQGSRTPEDASITATTADAEYAYFEVDRTGSPLIDHCVAAYYDCSKVYIYKYDQRTSPNFAGCGNSDYLQQANLTPGDTIQIRVDAWVPNGYPAGYLNTTTLTIYATSS